MRSLFWLVCFLLGASTSAQALNASVSYSTFKAPNLNFVEIYLNVVGSSVSFVPVDSTQYQASVKVIILFRQNGEVVKFDNYLLNSPVTTHLLDFIDLKRYGLENGVYELEVSVEDIHEEGNAKTYRAELSIDYGDDRVQQSDIQLLADIRPGEAPDPFVKNGFHLEGLPFNFYRQEAGKLSFYNEIYNTTLIADDFLVSYSIERVFGNGNTEKVLIGHKRRSPQPVVVLLIQMDITQLESGNYQLVVEVRDRHKELLSKKAVPFQRSNPYLNMQEETLANAPLEEEFVGKLTLDELRYSLKALTPLISATDGELLNLLIKNNDEQALKMFLFSYWTKHNPNQPQIAYEEYMEVARAVDQMFKSGLGYGFETDRGYIYLKYGRPDDIISEWNDPSAPPYEIWSYNEFPQTRQSNVRFIFYNPALAGGDFVLLHSTARGELNNPQWEVELYRNAPNEIEGSNYIDGTEMQDNFGRQARRRFRDF